MKDGDEIEKHLVRLEEKISRNKLLASYYCHVILPLTFNKPTPRILLILLFLHIVFIIFVIGFVYLLYITFK